MASDDGRAISARPYLKDTFLNFHQVQMHRRSLLDVVTEAAGPAGYACGHLPDNRLTFDKTNFLKNPKTWFHTLQNYGADWSFWHDSSEMEKLAMAEYKSAGRAE